MIRLLRIAVLSLTSTFALASATTSRVPWCIPRGGDGSVMATSIPAGGSDSDYAGKLEAVKTSVMDAAGDSVSIVWASIFKI
jgi:hypothetical protein